jgi:glycerol-3-phosphate dehydrogenase
LLVKDTALCCKQQRAGCNRRVYLFDLWMPEMPIQQQDVIVLGAGIVGVSTALHLQARGRSVCLIDKSDPGNGTSFGNAGLI